MHFWARGYCVSTVGLDENVIRKYIRDQEKSEQQQMELMKLSALNYQLLIIKVASIILRWLFQPLTVVIDGLTMMF